MKKRYLLLCILLLAGCKNKDNKDSNSESSSIESSIESSSSISEEFSSSTSSEIEENNFKGFFNAQYGEFDYSRRVGFNFEFEDLIKLDNTKYHRNLAKLGILLSSEVDGMYTFLDGKENKRPYLCNQMGMQDFEYIHLADYIYDYDNNDTTNYEIAHRKISNNEYIFVSIEGTDGSKEWQSNIDYGANIDTYYKLTGEHPEWTNKDNHKGFDVCANRVYSKVEEYIASKVDKDANKIIFITGHSRGGSIANLLGKLYEENDNYTSFTYSFASAATTTSNNIDEYKTIFNVLNTDDFVPTVPPEGMGFNLYGTTIKKSVLDEYSEKLNNLYGFDYVSANGKSLKRYVDRIANSRENPYEIDYKHSYTQSFLSYQAAMIQYDKEIEKFKKMNVFDLVEVTEPSKTTLGLYSFSINICPQYVIEFINDLIELDSFDINNLSLDDFKEITANNNYVGLMAACITALNSRGFQDSHMPSSYYAIVDYYND